MRLHIVARGRIGRGPEAELIARYVKRIAWPLLLTELPDTGGRAPDALVPARTIALDEAGPPMTSAAFAALLGDWRNSGVREVRFLIGAADGLSADDRVASDRLLSFGRATWPHLLVRAMLAEQIYRATTILAGHPYHREG